MQPDGFQNLRMTSLETETILNSIITSRQVKSPLADQNIKSLKEFNMCSECELLLITYDKNELIVDTGRINDVRLSRDKSFNYAEVPLGFIVEGNVVVSKGGKATKHLSTGDFIGLFETSDWILTDRKREIGDWTLKTFSPSKILYFSREDLEKADSSAGKFKKRLIELAKSDKVPQPITSMPLLDWTASHVTESRIADYVIVIHTHILPSTSPFFRHLAHLTNFGKIYILEKPYSTVRKTYDELIKSGCEIVQVQMEPGVPYEFSVKKSAEILWAKIIEEQKNNGFKKLLIVDDGGDLWHSVPWDHFRGVSIAGVEQTQRGITRVINSGVKIPPIINVAASGAKKIVESRFIGESIIDKLNKLNLITPEIRVGLIGLGSIGLAAAEALAKLDYPVKFYDPEPKNVSNQLIERSPSLDNLLNYCDLIIGTTGKDSLKGIAFDRVFGHKTIASASSADVEFSSLLKLSLPSSDPFDTRQVKVHEGLSIDILNGGYPLNFDRQKNAVPAEDIALTWCLMYTGAMQAAKLIHDGKMKSGLYDLDRVAQKKVLAEWIKAKKGREIYRDQIEKIVASTPENNSMKSIWQEE